MRACIRGLPVLPVALSLLSLFCLFANAPLAAGQTAPATAAAPSGPNLAVVATPSASFVSGHETLASINDGFNPRNSNDKNHGAYGNWDRTGTQWVQYDWPSPISTNRIDVYWFDDRQGVRVPAACRLKYWNGGAFVDVTEASGYGIAPSQYNTTTFAEITTTKLRLEIDSSGNNSTGVLEWKVYDSGKSPDFPPVLNAGVDRVVVLPGATYLNGNAKTVKNDSPAKLSWSKESGPGEVTFADASALATSATFSAPGEYVLRLSADVGELRSTDTLNVQATQSQLLTRLDPVYTKTYKINSSLWSGRMKALIVNWIPHCIAEIDKPNLKEGGIANFVEAGKKLAGQTAARHVGAPFANAWVHNTVESMCVALMVDPQGDADIAKAQAAYRAKLDEWIPIILSAQEPDGYLQTRFTLDTRNPPHWGQRTRGEHEGYVAGYFIEAAIAHYLATDGKDLRLYNAAKKLADCWDDHIGPAPKQRWSDGHQEMEQALVRFGRFINDVEEKGKGDKYIKLARFLLDCRGGGSEYDQSHVHVTRQYEAVGHAVRATYSYSAMADIAMETGDIDYQSAVQSIWSNLVHRKYYVIGGVGSGDTSEGFGRNYALRNSAYCESCANCGELFFQYRMNLAYHDSRYASLYEDTLYNAVLSDLDLTGNNFTYTNSLDTNATRYAWHVCPCCVGNFARTMLMLPTWMYARGNNELYVNLFAGSTVMVENVAGTSVEMVQATDYPWSGDVAITVNPSAAREFSLKIRQPNHNVSALYTAAPAVEGITSITVNGEPITPATDRGYAVITRTWKSGDKVELVLPMQPVRVKCDPKVAANVGRVALRYGPLIYNVESKDSNVDSVLAADAPLTAKFQPDLLGGVMTIQSQFSDGQPMTAIPNYARNNRGGRSVVWIRDQ